MKSKTAQKPRKKPSRGESVRRIDGEILRLKSNKVQENLISTSEELAKLRQKAEEIQYLEGVVDCLIEELVCLSALYQNDAVLEYARRILELSLSISYPKGVAYGKSSLALQYSFRHIRLEEGLHLASDALEIATQIGDRVLQWQSLHVLSSLFSDLGDDGRNYAAYKEALAIAEVLSTREKIITVINGAGDVFESPPQLYEEDLRRVVVLAEEQSTLPYLRMEAIQRYSIVLGRLGKFKECKHYRDQMIALLPEMPVEYRKFYHISLGYLFLLTGEEEDSIREYEIGIEAKPDPPFDKVCALQLGLLYTKRDKRKALQYYESVLSMPIEPYEPYARDFHSNLAQLYNALGMTEKAIEQYAQYARTTKDFEEQEKKRREENASIIQRYDEAKQKQRQLAEEVESKSTALATKAMLLAEQTEFMANFRDDMRAILRKVEANDPAINEIRKKLRELPEAVNWKEFDEQFQAVHPQFHKQLEDRYPTLTNTELKLCVLLRLGLNSRDISRLMVLSKRTIENHRHNIRKKLFVEPDEDIAKFLSHI